MSERKILVLIALSDSLRRRGLVPLLEHRRRGVSCTEASSGSEALDRARLTRPEVIITETSMVDMSATDLIVQTHKCLPDSRFMVIADELGVNALRDVLAAGAQAVILPSDSEQTLLRALDSVIANQAFLTAAVAEIVLTKSLKSSHPDTLSPREVQMAQLVAQGKSSKQAAQELGISVRTAESYRAALKRKLGAQSLSDIVKYAIRSGMVKA